MPALPIAWCWNRRQKEENKLVRMRSVSLSQVWLQSRPLLARLLVVAVETTHSSYLILQLNCTALSSRAVGKGRRGLRSLSSYPCPPAAGTAVPWC